MLLVHAIDGGKRAPMCGSIEDEDRSFEANSSRSDAPFSEGERKAKKGRFDF